MQKKFWSALLSMAMIISCFSGVASAAPITKNYGAPGYEVNSPTSTNIYMSTSQTATVTIAPRTAYTLSGRLAVQGSESTNSSQYMTTERVADLYRKLVGDETIATSALSTNDKTLVMGLVNDPSVNGDQTSVDDNVVKYALQRWYLDSVGSSANSLSTTKSSILANKFIGGTTTNNRDNFLTVETDGRFSDSFVPEFHTTRLYGFGIKSLGKQDSDGYWVFPYETSDQTSAASGDHASAALTAYSDYVTANIEAYATAHGPVASLDANVVTKESAYTVAYEAYYNGEAAYNAAVEEMNRLTGIWEDAVAASSAADATYTSENQKLIDAGTKLDDLEGMHGNYFTSVSASTYGSVTGDVINAAVAVLVYTPVSYSLTIANLRNKLSTAVYEETYIEIAGDVVVYATDAVDAQQNYVDELKGKKDELAVEAAGALTKALEAQTYANQMLTAWRNVTSQNVTDAKTAYDNAVAELASYTATMNVYTDAATKLYDTYLGYNSAIGGNTPIQSTIYNRLLQGKPLEVRFQYKLRDAAQTFVSGTSTAQTISGYIVDANGNAPEHDFEYVVYKDNDVPTTADSGDIVARGRTSGGYFIFTINNMDSVAEYYLFPTQRYDSKYNEMVDISPTNPATRYYYFVANGTRQAFYKAELETTTAVSNVTYQTLELSKLYTYDDRDEYDALGRSQAAYLYGVSYAIRKVGTNDFLTKQYRIMDYGTSGTVNQRLIDQNVRFSYSDATYFSFVSSPWTLSADKRPTYIFDATAVGINTPLLKVEEDGTLSFNGTAVEICFIGTGTASLRLRAIGRTSSQTSPRDAYQSILTIKVESPGIVAHTSGTELKKINFSSPSSNDPFVIGLISTSDTAITELRLNKIRFEGKEDDDYYLEEGESGDAKDNTLTYKITGDEIKIYVPWDLVTTGGQDLELDLDFLTSSSTIVTSKTITVKNSLWNVSASVATISVATNNSFTATVTDGDGVEQNTAYLQVWDESTSIGQHRSYNVVGGRYTFENINPSRGGSMYIVVRDSNSTGDVKTILEIQAVGKADYTATMESSYENAVTGLSSSIRFDVVNSSGTAATDLTNASILNLSGKKSGNFAKNGDDLSLSHQGNGNYRIPVVGLKPGSYILRVSTNNMTHYVDIPFEVLPLQIEFSNSFEALTWDTSYGKNADFRDSNKMTFTVKNPMTGAVIATTIDSSKLELVDADAEKSDLILTVADTYSTSYPNGNITLTDKDYSRYLVNNYYDNHEFYVGLVDTRSASTRNAEGELGLRFYLKVREGGSTGDEHSVEGFTVPVAMPTITTNPTSVARGTTTAVDLYVKDANGNPVIGVQVRTDGEDMAQRTDGDGKTTYLFTPLTTGSSKRFDISAFAVDQTVTYRGFDTTSDSTSTATVKSSPVYTTVNIINDVTAPTITLDPYVSETTKSSVTISGKLFDEGGLSEIVVGNSGRRYSGQTEATFSYSIPLELGNNAIVIMAFDSSNSASEITVNVMRKEASVMVLTVGSTETVGVSGLDVAPVVRNGVTFLPIRFVFENMLKGKVDYDANSKTITASFMGHTLVLTIGSTTAILDGQNITLSSAPEIDPATNRTLAPIRTILQSVGITVDYNAANGAITITGAGDQDVITYPSNTAAPTTTTTPAAEVEVEEEVVEEEVVEEEVVEEEVEEEVTE